MEVGESIETALKREMKEELGLEVKEARFVGEELYTASDRERQRIHYFLIDKWGQAEAEGSRTSLLGVRIGESQRSSRQENLAKVHAGMSSDSWLYWYWGKEGTVDNEIPILEQFFKKKSVSKILDLGCGTGRHVIYFAKRGYQVSGFDWSEAAVTRARELVRAENLTADLRVWDMTRNPFPYDDSQFDAILAMRVIHHTTLEKISRIMREVVRVTKQGGLLFLQVPTYEEALRLKEEGSKLAEVEPGTFLPLEGDEKGILHHHFTRGELLFLLVNYSLVDLVIRDEHYCAKALRK